MPVYIESEKGGFLMIYCVEDESTIRDLMVYTLKASGFEGDLKAQAISGLQ